MRRLDLLAPAAAGIAIAYGAILALLAFSGRWILDAAGHPIVTDFLPVHATGKFAWQGDAARAYDPIALHAAQVGIAGHDFAGFLGWHYPPLFFAIAMTLALMPYGAAFFAWVAATLLLFATTLTRISGRRVMLLGLALPPTLACAMVGQNGFFSAALFGIFLLLLPHRPIAAALVIALLAYKPQFGVLIPAALLAGGYWRAAIASAAMVLGWVMLAAFAWPHSLGAFLHFLPQTSEAVLGSGSADWAKLQSVYGAARLFGLSSKAAWCLQLAAMLGAAVYVARLWSRHDVPFALKAAMLVAASLIATPYAYFYDLPLLAIAIAFFIRAGLPTRSEARALLAIGLLLAIDLLWTYPAGPVAAATLLALGMRRRGIVRGTATALA